MSLITPESEEAKLSEPNGIYMTDNPNSEVWDIAAEMEAVVFIAAGYVKDRAELEKEYEPYVPVSEFAVANTRFGEHGGSVRIMHYDSKIGFKTVKDVQSGRLEVSEEGRARLDALNLSKAIEVGTIGVPERYREQPEKADRVAVPLYGAVYDSSVKYDAPTVIASFDAEYFDRFAGIFGPACQPLGPATVFMGSPTVPALIDVPLLIEHVGHTMPELRDGIVETGAKISHT